MNNYTKILKEIENSNINITKLYIYDIVKDHSEALKIMETVYDLWLDIDADISISRLADLVKENWKDYKKDKYTIDDIIMDLLN